MAEELDAATVLVVADDEATRDAIADWLRLAAYISMNARAAGEALDLLRLARPQVAVIALGQGGLDFLHSAREQDPLLGVVVLGAGTGRDALPAGEWPGVSFLQAGWGATELLGAVGAQLRRWTARAAEAQWRQALDDAVADRSASLERKLERFTAASLEVLVTALEARDPFMTGHSIRVAQLSASLADTLGHSEEEVEAVRLAGRLHDIGMMTISDQVVNRLGPLSEVEREQVREHPVVGHRLLQPYAHLSQVARFVRGHHERWDGTGYPDGLAGEEILWGARLIAVAEIYDALVTSRAYRREIMTPVEASEQVQALAGSALDPASVGALTGVIGQRRTLDFVLDPGPVDKLG